jgi:hypothetical protein
MRQAIFGFLFLKDSKLYFFLFFILATASLNASSCIEIKGGPLLEHLKRIRDGGSRQSGDLYGFECLVARRPLRGIYFCCLYRYEEGYLYGQTGFGDALISKKTDQAFEGALGYTLPVKNTLTCTPFVGKGRIFAKNSFEIPSPIEACFDVRYNYWAGGFRADWKMNAEFSLGFLAKGIFSEGATCKVVDPEEEESKSLIVEDELSWEIELPLVHCSKKLDGRLRVGLTPFYRYRHWGGHENYPYNFFDTKFYILGATLSCSYHF